MANNVVNFKRGTAAQYNAATKDADTLYFVTSSGGSSSVEMGELFLGSVRIGVGIGTSADPSTNKTYYGLKNYADGNFVSAVAEGNANGKIAVTKNGTTTQISVHGLGSAAYTDSTAYATKAQGDKADSAIQGVDSSDSDAISFTTDANKIAYAEIHLDGTGAIPLAVVPGNGISASLNSSYVDGSLSTSASGKLLTKGAADGYYEATGAIRSISSGNTTALVVEKTGNAVVITPMTASVDSNSGQLTTGAQVKAYVDSKIGDLGHALRYVGDSATVPTEEGATVSITGGFFNDWKVGDVVTCNAVGYTSKEYLLYQGSGSGSSLNIPANWRELGEEDQYALKAITITGTGYLEGGGDLSTNRTIDLKSTYKTKISDAIQSISGDNAISATTNTNRATTISLTLDSTSGQLDFTKGTNGLYASLKTGYVEGSLTTSNKLLTASYGDGRYGRLASANTWTGTNNFQGTVYFEDPNTSDTILGFYPSTGSQPSSLSLGYSGTNVSIEGNITSDLITCSAAPSSGNHLANRTYVDGAITTALTWASI